MFNFPIEIFDISFVKVFAALTAIVYIIFRFQVLQLFFKVFSNRSGRGNKYKSEKLKVSRLPDELDEIIEKGNIPYSPGTEIKFHLTSVTKTNNEYQVYLSLTGSAVRIIDISSSEFDLTALGPKQLAGNNSGFYFRFRLAYPDKKEILFKIVYEDQIAVKYSKKYLLSISENILKEID